MGTLVSITIVHPDGAEARAMAEKAFDEMERLEQVLSRHRSGTSLARLNERGSITDAPLELLEVVRHAIRYSELTGGAFDVTVTPVLELYRASFADSGASPGDAELREALSLVGYRGIKVAGSEIELDRPGMSLTLDGIAKGYVVDSVVRVLAGAGAQRVVVDAGGDMSSSPQTERSEPWRVAIQDPRETGTSVDVLRLRGESVATSGDYMQSFTQDRSVHHIIDPRTGSSPAYAASVSVVTPTAMAADALSTAVMVMGPGDGLRLLEEMEGVEGLIVTKGRDVLRTRGFRRYTEASA